MKNISDLVIGDKHGKLTIKEIYRDPKNKYTTKFKCLCECGNFSHPTSHNFYKTTSCGCIRIKNEMSFKGHKNIYGKWWFALVKRAKKSKKEFTITIEDAWALYEKQKGLCAITGISITFPSRSGASDGTASLDRIDSDKGYVADNIQWIHKDINELKWDNSLDDLIKICNKVVTYQQRKSVFDVPQEDLDFISSELSEDNFAFEGKTILLCGAFGFLGKLFQSYFLYINENILREPCRVICIDNYIVGEKFPHLKIDNFQYITHDICKQSEPSSLPDKIDFLLNCSGIASPIFYNKFPFETIEVSYNGTREIIKLIESKKISSSLFFSSSEVYGNPPEEFVPTKEDYIGSIDTMGKRSCYDVGKLCLETLCYIAHEKYGANIKIIRPFNVFGYIPKTDGRVIPNFVSSILEDKKIKIYGDGKQTRTFCWFGDFLVGAVKVLLHGDNKPYNIGNASNEISMLDLAKMVENTLNVKNMVELIPSPSVYQKEPRRRCPDISKAKRDLNYNPKVSLEEGLKKFATWASKEYKI